MKTQKAFHRNSLAALPLLALVAVLAAFALPEHRGAAVSARGSSHSARRADAPAASTAEPARAAHISPHVPGDAQGVRAAEAAVEAWVKEELSSCPQLAGGDRFAPYAAAAAIPPPVYRPRLEHANGWYYPTGSSNYQYLGWLGYNPNFNGYHLAQDMANPEGDPVYAVDYGEVLYSQCVGGYGGPSGGTCGGAVAIQHRAKDGTWFTALYGHLHNYVSAGTRVYAGDVIGYSNNWSPPHVHFGVRLGANPDPANWYVGYTSSTSNTLGFTNPNTFLGSYSACKNGTSVNFRPNNAPPVHPNGTLVRSVSDATNTVYLLRDGQKQGITSPAALRNLYPNGGFDFKDVIVIAQDEFERYPTGSAISGQLPSNGRTHSEGRLIKRSPGGEISIVTDNGTRRGFVSAQVFTGLGYLFCNVADATAANYDSYPTGPPVTGEATTNSCTYSVSPQSRTVASAGGNNSFGVTAGSGCSWTASSNASWLSVTSGGSGSGGGTVGYSVAQNTGQQRAGSITVSGGSQSFTHTVTQDAGVVVTNPTAQQVSDYADQLSVTYKVPSVVIKALLEQESGWRQFNSDGSTVTHTEPDGRIGVGLTQVTVQNTSSVTLSLGVIQEGTPQGSNPFTTTTSQVSVSVDRLKTEWQYNMEVGVRVLVAKKVSSAGAGDDATILENWYYPLAYYNGAVKGGANDPNNASYSRSVSTASDWKSVGKFPYQECVFNIIAQLYTIPAARSSFYGPAIKVTLPGPSAVGSGAGQYGYVEPVFCFYDWAIYYADGAVQIGNWGGSGNGCITAAKTRTGVSVHKVKFGAPGSAPSAPTITSPGTASEPGASVATTTPVFQWNASPEASSYSLYVSKSPYGSANIVYSNTTLTGTSFTPPAGTLVSGEKYRWNMTASNASGESGVSNTLYFNVEAPPETRTLTVASSNPASGVSVTTSPADNGGSGTGNTPFTRTYNVNTSVSLTAPATAGGNSFEKWLRDGADYSSGRSVNVTLVNNHTLTAVYATPPPGLRIDSVIPAAGPTGGEQQVRLTGQLQGVSGVSVGGNSATWSYTNGTSEITLTTPPHAVGAVSIVLTPAAGSPYTKPNAFAYLPTSFTDDPLVAGVTQARAQHVIELRQAVDALRAVAGLPQAQWTEPVLVNFVTPVKFAHIGEIRTYMEDAAVALGYARRSYTDPTYEAGLVIKRVHVEELRLRILALAGECPRCLL
jgi:hypothetical protein